ncbi:hypothetical protein BS50DRAFT_623902 [Corynespora cassiicola Philippines]|uniref:AA1-like domain-containing protein n=1 Tax=Corynespora cassiicola Philippines TaxID=1448308 RepID=A0A2T2NCG5_CORCC|nr:hypothetical protein BS50DRAFT_623902 [Corynespora cassiicola Philippines]
MRFSVLAFAGLACAAPSLMHRQEDYGYWNVTVTTESGRPGWQTRDVVARYHNPNIEDPFLGVCSYRFVPQGTRPPVETSTCTEGFEYSWGQPWYTLNLTQTVEIGGEQVTLYGGSLLERRCGLGSGSACRAEGRIEAGIVPLSAEESN